MLSNYEHLVASLFNNWIISRLADLKKTNYIGANRSDIALPTRRAISPHIGKQQ